MCSEATQQTAQLRLAADPAAFTIAPSTSATVNVVLTGGNEGDIYTLSSNAGNQSGLMVPSTPVAIGGSGSAMITVTALPTAPTTGTALLTLTAARGAADATTQLTVTFAPAFSAGASGLFSGERGDTLSGSLSIARFAGFVGPIAMSVVGAPPGVEVDLPTSASVGTNVIPFAVRISPTAALGLYTARILLKYEATEREVILAGQIVATTLPPDFAIATTPDTIQLTAGDSASALVSVARSAPGIGPVTLTTAGLPAGTTSSFAPAAVNDTTRLTLATSPTTPAGTFPIVLTGTADTIVRRDTIVLVVTDPPSLSVIVNPRTITVEPGAIFNVAVAATLIGSPGPVTFTSPNIPAGFGAQFTPDTTNAATMRLTIGSVTPATYYVRVRATAGALAAVDSIEVIVAPPAGDFSIALPASITLEAGATVFAPINITRSGSLIGGSVQINVTPIPSGGNAWPAPSRTVADTSTLQIIGGNPGTFPLIVSGAISGSIRADTIVVIVTPGETPNFFLTPVQKEFSLTRGQFQTMQLTVGRIFGHSGVVTLSAVADDPANYVVEFAPPATGPTGNATINVQVYASPNVPPGPHVLVLRGSSGGVTRTALVTLRVF